MEKSLKNKTLKSMITLSAGLMLSTALAPTVVSTVEASQSTEEAVPENDELSQVEIDNLVNEIVTTVETSEETVPLQTNQLDGEVVQPQSVSLGLLAALAAKYGAVWLKTTLPKLVYSSVAPLLGSGITEAKFVSIFNNAANAASTAAFRSALRNGLVAAGMSETRASAVATAVVTAVTIIS